MTIAFSTWSFLAGAGTATVLVAFLAALCSLIAGARADQPYDQEHDQ